MEGEICDTILTTMPFGSGPWGELTHYFLQHVHYYVLTPLLYQSAALLAFSAAASASAHPALPLPPPPVSQAGADTQTHSRHAGLPAALSCASSGHGLAGQYKPDIKVMLLAL